MVAEPAVTWLLKPALGLLGLEAGAHRVVSVVVAVVLINLIHKIWGEQAPTYLGVERPRAVAAVCAPIHYWWCKATRPVILLGDGAAKLTLRALGVEMTRSWARPEVDADRDSGSKSGAGVRTQILKVLTRSKLPKDRQREVVNAIDIDQRPVSEVMTSRNDAIALDVNRPKDVFDELERGRLTRYPLIDGDWDHLLGFIYVPALLADRQALASCTIDLEKYAVSPLMLAAHTPISQAIDQFQRAGQEIAAVCDRHGALIGIVTITDTLEATFGEISDPYDAPSPHPPRLGQAL